MTAELIPLGEAVRALGSEAREPVELDKEDDVAHAEQALHVLRNWYSTTSSIDPVYCNGAWWYYKAGTGCWHQAPESTAERCVLELRKFVRHTTRDGEPRKMRMSNGKHEAVYRMMKKMARDDEFFDSVSPSVSFRNDTTVVFAYGPRKEKLVSGYSPSYRCRSYYDFKFDAQAGCPKWLAFLDSVFLGDEDAADKKRVLQEFVGAAMRGEATHYEKALLLLGSGRNGKSIFCDVVSRLFDGKLCSIAPQDLSDERQLVALEGKSLNLVSDIPVRGFTDSGGFKQVLSGDLVSYRRLYQETVQMRPTAAHMFSANDLPKSPDLSAGFYRRWLIVNFGRTFGAEDSRPREELLSELVSELPGIAMWALVGSKNLRERKAGFLQPRSSKMIVGEWSANNNIVQQFTIQATDHVQDGDAWVRSGELYEAYKDWSRHNGHAVMSSTLFYQRLRALHYLRRNANDKVEYNLRIKPRALWHGSAEGAPKQEDLLK